MLKITEESIIAACATVFDPEIPVNIYDLGLIYTIEIAETGAVKIEMTLTAPGCPAAQELPIQIRTLSSPSPACPAARWKPSGIRPGINHA